MSRFCKQSERKTAIGGGETVSTHVGPELIEIRASPHLSRHCGETGLSGVSAELGLRMGKNGH